MLVTWSPILPHCRLLISPKNNGNYCSDSKSITLPTLHYLLHSSLAMSPHSQWFMVYCSSSHIKLPFVTFYNLLQFLALARFLICCLPMVAPSRSENEAHQVLAVPERGQVPGTHCECRRYVNWPREDRRHERMAPPQNLKKLQVLIRTVKDYRQYRSDFATDAGPLMQLTVNGAESGNGAPPLS